jgi:hypothetical protein
MNPKAMSSKVLNIALTLIVIWAFLVAFLGLLDHFSKLKTETRTAISAVNEKLN